MRIVPGGVGITIPGGRAGNIVSGGRAGAVLRPVWMGC
jgi:hypothetical protein